MEVSQEALETIGNFVRRNFRTWFEETVQPHITEREIDQRERWIRTEEELKSQRQLMMMGLEQMEKRFEQVDKRFEQVDRRFSDQREDINTRFDDMHRHTNRWMTALSIMIGLVGVAATIANLM